MKDSLERLTNNLKEDGTLKNEAIKSALLKVDRAAFVPPFLKSRAYDDIALPLVEGQTISQPTTVVFMLELLDLKSGDRVLDIGAGSGWTSCLLGEIIGKNGAVFAYEINKMVGSFGLSNIRNFGAKNVSYEIGDAAVFWEEHAPYDKIHAGAAFEKVPKELLLQLEIGGIFVGPTKEQEIRKIIRSSKNEFKEEIYPGFVFVPFTRK